ncbi:hypothetical protein K437DRAFT_223035 [Tilletiaria anomala UBC 951]|uniref:VWFA domain-containing protein n=1 Tax=Tilletiaria anomala (strain ATCC 24038 / CBS 436.72 / UBC 951) TaxID=1037660 RepID=A0A066W9S4_TILAU|nr:uncharacterized protein K437DRAFT_223035 [Tilletiaria anomala UBC 951]KDN47530.1 hypothetical protein K437DRAFT_223035 [Tilletiaria anomala UBC 951]
MLEDEENLDLDLQSRYAQFREATQPALDGAADLWQSYTARTSDLAFQLCEQLRLILSPTHATRMKGDYRTGKRLNMRQIIPFIASDFAKDKIWLRRTKPSARRYQVLLSIDDSKSMAHSRTAHLAMQTVTLLSSALTKLEVGDISICRFGRHMDILHGFGEQSFSRHDGARMISSMSFGQRSTDVLKLLQSSLSYLADARSNQSTSGTGELWQLQIIVSDGMCEDHDRLRCLLRQANENRVVVVFVILDALNDPAPAGAAESASQPQQQQRSSILSMNRVSYQSDSQGKMELKMERYLDTFPFDNFVIVRDVQSLPDVLSATLRQWAERVNAA